MHTFLANSEHMRSFKFHQILDNIIFIFSFETAWHKQEELIWWSKQNSCKIVYKMDESKIFKLNFTIGTLKIEKNEMFISIKRYSFEKI